MRYILQIVNAAILSLILSVTNCILGDRYKETLRIARLPMSVYWAGPRGQINYVLFGD